MTPILSIIIPVYNSEKTLRRCINSVLVAKTDSIEIILINDGSTDSSSIICEEYSNKYSYIHYFERENKGVSSARNAGLDHAKGEWILFLDSDDCYLDNWEKTINHYLSNYDADYYQFSWVKKGNASTTERISRDQIGNTNKNSAIILAREMYNKRLNVPYAKLFKKAIIDKYNIRFQEDLPIGEDMLFVFSYVLKIRRTITSSTQIYCAFIDNSDSLSRKKREMLLDQLLLVDEKAMNILSLCDLPSDIKNFYREVLTWSYYRKAYTASKELMKFDYPIKERLQKEKKICEKFDTSRLKNANIKTKIIAFPVITRMAIIIDLLSFFRTKK